MAGSQANVALNWLRRVAIALTPIGRRVPRAKGFLLRLARGLDPDDTSWRDLPCRFRVYYDRTARARIPVDLSIYYQRLQFFHGHFRDQMNPLLIQRFVRPGDTYIDVGAHTGYHSVCASRAVDSGGVVYAFEPNPEIFRYLETHSN